LAIIRESGNLEGLVSLGGVRSKPGLGRIMETSGPIISGTQQVMNDNPKRISAILCNRNTVPMIIHFDTQTLIELLPDAAMQIDINFPWTGAVFCTTTGGAGVLGVVEVSVP